jgi:hypothetical protein
MIVITLTIIFLNILNSYIFQTVLVPNQEHVIFLYETVTVTVFK